MQGRFAALDDIPLLSQWIKKSKSEDLDFLSMGYKKDILGIFAYEFELLRKSRHSRAYHQDGVLHIINSGGIVYHHCESGFCTHLKV